MALCVNHEEDAFIFKRPYASRLEKINKTLMFDNLNSKEKLDLATGTGCGRIPFLLVDELCHRCATCGRITEVDYVSRDGRKNFCSFKCKQKEEEKEHVMDTTPCQRG